MKPRKSKEAILESSLKLFCSNGFGNTSIKKIATSAGISQGNIYNYFSNKEEIFEELFRDNFPGNFIELFIKGISEEKSLDENIETVLENLATFADKNTCFFKLIILDANEFGGKYLKKYSSPFNKPIEDYFIKSIRLSELRKDIDSVNFTYFFGWLLYALGLTNIIYMNNEGKSIKSIPEYKILLSVLKKGLKE